MEPRLAQHQTQRLVLSPQIRQYLKLLQMPLMELSQAVDVELAENPVLEETSAESRDDAPLLQELPASVKEKSAEELRLGDSYDKLEQMDENFRENYGYQEISNQDPKDLQKRKNFQETLITKPEALSDFLMWQVRFIDFDETEKKIAEEIIGNIDEDGFFKATFEEVAAVCQAEVLQVEKVLEQIQQLDPPGIGARTLQEALILQLKKKGPEAVLAVQIATEYLPLLKKREWHQIAKILSTDEASIKNAVRLISRLEPKPGRTFYVEDPIAITPDASVSYSDEDDNKLKVEIHNESIPELRINLYYRKMLRDKNLDEKTKTFLREKMLAAVNFLKALKLRKSTLREITEELMKVQVEFFEKGFSHLRPLRLKDIAQTLGIHESTVSRALHGKYIQTPQGTIPYKSFFSTKLETTSGEEESQKSIMQKIRSLVEKEDAVNPLSDQEIVKRLQAEGIVIARRTVAKYRDLMRVMPSHLRRAK